MRIIIYFRTFFENILSRKSLEGKQLRYKKITADIDDTNVILFFYK